MEEKYTMDYLVALEGVADREDLHDRLAAGLALPDWYGRNLDALHDVLGQMQGKLVITGFTDSQKVLGQYAQSLFRVLMEVAAENPKLKITLQF